MSNMKNNPVLRGIYSWEEEEDIWREATKTFVNKVPRFDNKDDCQNFMLEHCARGSNPDNSNLQHIFTNLTSWEQIEKYLIPKIKYYEKQYPSRPYTPLDNNSNVFCNKNDNKMDNDNETKDVNNDNEKEKVSPKVIHEQIKSRLDLPIHSCTSELSTINTLKYLFYHMRCGIFVMIRHGKLLMFVPFVNSNYRNTWGDQISFDSMDGTAEKYYKDKQNYYREENILPDRSQWWANGNILCNEKCPPRTPDFRAQLWSDAFLCVLKDMLSETCRTRDVADCQFFINKRDYPHLKVNTEGSTCKVVEPYGFLWDKDDRDPSQDIPLAKSQLYSTYAPIASFYVSKRFADIPWPTSEDWEAATGSVFPNTFQHHYNHTRSETVFESNPRDLFTEENFQKFNCNWEDKVETAFFRGSATGGGTTEDTNQRLALAQKSFQWEENSKYCKTETTPAYLDAKITSLNLRDKKIAGEQMTFAKQDDFDFEIGRNNFVPIYQQSRYKYLLYVEGHCAACRYAFMMRLGSVILKVDSNCVADEIWYFPLLVPYVDHVPVKADLSDLDEKIAWCRSNDEECKKIASAAAALYDKYISKDGILDYLELITHEISTRHRYIPSWCKDIPSEMKILKTPQGYEQKGCYSQRHSDLCKSCKILGPDKISNKSSNNNNYGNTNRKRKQIH